MVEALIEILNNVKGDSIREKAEYLINEGVVVVPKVEKVYEVARLCNCIVECNVASMAIDELKRFYDEKWNFYTSLEAADEELARVKQSERTNMLNKLIELINEVEEEIV